MFDILVINVTQHDKTHKNVPEIKKMCHWYHMKGQLFSFSMVKKIISIMHSVGKLWTLKVKKQ